MAITGFTYPNEYMHGYNTIPLKLGDTLINTLEGYQYLVSITGADEYTSTSLNSYTIGNNVYTQVNFGSEPPFKAGDIVIRRGISGGKIAGYHNVLAKPSTTSIVLDIEWSSNLGLSTLYLYEHITRYKIPPGPDGLCKVDLGNTLKNYVTQNLEDSDDIYAGPNTHLKCYIGTGFEYNQDSSIDFTDNYFYNDTVGFVVSNYGTLEIGDTVEIQQDPLELTYNNAFSYDKSVVDPTQTGIAVAYILDDAVALTLFGDGNLKYKITVEGQTTYPNWNGDYFIWGPFSSTILLSTANAGVGVADGTYSGEGGSLWSVPIPEYNTTATITAIFSIGGGQYVVATDIPWEKSSPAISGKILRSTNVTKASEYNVNPDYDLNVYNGYISNRDWSLTAMDDYLLTTTGTTKGFSTILSKTNTNRIEFSTKSWVLAHNKYPSETDGVQFNFFDVNGTLLNTTNLRNLSGNDEDFYVPIGIDQIINATNKIETTPNLSAIKDQVDYYSFKAAYDTDEANPLSATTLDETAIVMEVNDDCSQYDLLHLLWKDAKGSWLSYPFKYIHTESREVSRSEYYKNPFDWDANGFTYKGNKSYFTRSRDKMVLNSGWVDDNENYLMKDLISSADTYLQDKDGNILGCQILNTELVLGSEQKDQIFQYQMEIKLANDEIRL